MGTGRRVGGEVENPEDVRDEPLDEAREGTLGREDLLSEDVSCDCESNGEINLALRARTSGGVPRGED